MPRVDPAFDNVWDGKKWVRIPNPKYKAPRQFEPSPRLAAAREQFYHGVEGVLGFCGAVCLIVLGILLLCGAGIYFATALAATPLWAGIIILLLIFHR